MTPEDEQHLDAIAVGEIPRYDWLERAKERARKDLEEILGLLPKTKTYPEIK